MKRTIITTTEVVAASLVLLIAGAGAALAHPPELGPDYPSTNGTVVVTTTSGVDFATQLRWMVTGAGVVLALAATVLVAILWHRAHAHAQSERFVTS
jgi:hypothetical protein